ncbi:hypothetical protein [Arthrobacter sp. W4I7]|nr:hypothetical protein [Arthrobacter sp. W4I7]MDQ0691031.1 hypothetical protein [Arthrobacter sp. W4I7]
MDDDDGGSPSMWKVTRRRIPKGASAAEGSLAERSELREAVGT